MRFQSIYLDMRPMLTKWLGILATLVFFSLIIMSFRPDFERALAQSLSVYRAQHEAVGNGNGLRFWTACLNSAACRNGLLLSWTAPLVVKSALTSGLVFGIFSASFGLYWRPEVMANRDMRVNSVKVEESRQTSPVPPGGTL